MDREYHKTFTRDVRPEDVEHIVQNMRQADKDEITASKGGILSIKNVVDMSLKMSPNAQTITCPGGSGEPIALLGTVPPSLLGNFSAKPWMLGTNAVFRYPRAIVQGGRGYVRDMLELHYNLINYVDVRNIVSVRWLKAIGFEIHEPEPYGPANMLFHKFTAQRSHGS